jgi:uncharacterized protein
MFTLALSRIRTAQERFDRVYQPGQLAGDHDDFTVIAPATLGFDIHKDKDQFRLVGHVLTTLELRCSRCLESFSCPVNAAFDLRYQPSSRNTGEGEQSVEEDDLTTAFYENDEIDLGQLMKEQFYLSLPMKPLCQEGCKGLCPTCGTNWNRAACDCRREWEDPRLIALNAIKEKPEHHKEH